LTSVRLAASMLVSVSLTSRSRSTVGVPRRVRARRRGPAALRSAPRCRARGASGPA
jgi:hypothetical protein